MKASNVMTIGAITVRPDTTIAHAAHLMLEDAVSGLPVVDAQGRPVGIVTESDLLHRKEIGTQRRRSQWLEDWMRAGELARQYAREHGGKVGEVMTREVVVAEPTTPLSEVVERMEHHKIKRLPIVRDGKVIGMVSRSNLLRALSAQMTDAPSYEPSEDLAIRKRIYDGMSGQGWAAGAMTDIQVHHGVVDFYGTVASEDVRQALRVLAENTPGVVRVYDRLRVEPRVS